MENFVITMPSDLSVEEAVESVKTNAIAEGLNFIALHDMNEKMVANGLELAKRCCIIEVCSARYAKSVIDRAPEVSSSLPCRISIYQKNGRTELATLAVTTMLRMYKDAAVETADIEMESTVLRIMARAQGPVSADR